MNGSSRREVPIYLLLARFAHGEIPPLPPFPEALRLNFLVFHGVAECRQLSVKVFGRVFKLFGVRRQWIWAEGEAERLEHSVTNDDGSSCKLRATTAFNQSAVCPGIETRA